MHPTTWRYTGQSVIGVSHVRSETPCQDAHCVAVKGQQFIAVVADGAGSAQYADVAAGLVTEATLALINAWPALPDTEDTWRERWRAVVAALRQQLAAKASELACPVRELASTWLAVVASEQGIAGAQIGDGAIVYGLAQDAELHLLTAPEQGEYLNETTFLISEEVFEHLQTAYLPGRVDRVALLSDGLQMLALDMRRRPPVPHQPFFRPLFEFVRTEADAAGRDRQLQALLASPRVCQRTDDDKTLILVAKAA